jgi:mono/diheme cytochrome c family protein
MPRSRPSTLRVRFMPRDRPSTPVHALFTMARIATPLRPLLLTALLGVLACASPGFADETGAQDFQQIERGRYLAAAADCSGCHTDPQGGSPYAGGRPIQTPFGRVLAANITPDRDTGIGAWSDAEFDAAVRGGRMPSGGRLYPAMPYAYYARMSKEDVQALRAYLNTLAPVRKEVHSNQLPFPFDIRAAMRVWDALYFKPGVYQPDPQKSQSWNRGAYLVTGPGHCGACHTPKTSLGGDETGKSLEGYSVQGWFAPDITDDSRRGLGDWSPQDILEYLKNGHNRFAGAAGPMSEEVANGSSHMSNADLLAIAAYLKDQHGQAQQIPAISVQDPAMVAGSAIYQDLCSACHRGDGRGIPYLIPDLAGSASVASERPTSLVRVVLIGAKTVATNEEPTGPAMPSFQWQLNDTQVAAVTTYVRNSWGHAAQPTTARDVRKARRQLDVSGN